MAVSAYKLYTIHYTRETTPCENLSDYAALLADLDITKTHLYNFDPLNPTFI